MHLSGGLWKPAAHLSLLNRKIWSGIGRGGGRFIVAMPPRHGKSEYCSHWLPTTYISKRPRDRVLFGSYSSEFANRWGRMTRDTLIEHGDELGGVRISKDVSSAGNWNTTLGGGMTCAGVGGPFTGYGANLEILDDLVKNAEEAFSATVRESVWEWWKTTARTRLEPGATVVLVMTRWHPDDIAGRILKAEPGVWDYIRLPAIAEENDPIGRAPGAPLWAARYPLDVLEEIRKAVGPITWAAMFQASPIDASSGMFKRVWFEIVRGFPLRALVMRSWDLASTEPKDRADPDWTVGVKIAYMKGVFWIVDVVRVRADAPSVRRLIKQTALLDGGRCAIALQQDPGQAGKAQIADLTKLLKGFSILSEPASGDKVLRADPYAGQAGAGNVKLVYGEWNAAFLEEHEGFPTGKFDDQVDAASWGMSQIVKWGSRLWEPSKEEEKEPRVRNLLDGLMPNRDTPSDDDEDDEFDDD